MSQATCPTCQMALDPVRAAVARVVDGRVVAYCSTACADGLAPASGAAAAAVIAATPVSPPATRSDGDLASRAEVKSVEPSARRRRRVIALSGAIIVGGMVVAVLDAISPSAPSRVAAEVAARAPTTPMPPPAPLSAPALVERAKQRLAGFMTDPSLRVRRLAAAALARTGDHAAIEVLVAALAEESAELARLDVAYALGRAGDSRGVAALKAALSSSSRRDVKSDAARLLALLGDDTGATYLRSLVGLSQHRLSAAEVLAGLGDDKALAILESVRGDDHAGAEERARAIVALGRARRGDVADDLKAILDDGRFNVGAAAALARLGDPSSASALTAQLGVPSLRVGAAISLRRLTPGLDATSLLPPLLDAMSADKDVTAISAAETILLLAGPATLAERD